MLFRSTIVPLTSIKQNKDLSNLRSGEVLLGNELFLKFSKKFTDTFYNTKKEHRQIEDEIKQFKENKHGTRAYAAEIENKQRLINNQLNLLEKMNFEISKMKHGSIALVNQITTISKIRIYDPKKNKDMLSGIKLSEEGLNKIDQEIIKKFTR